MIIQQLKKSLTLAYRNILGREAGQAGLDYWTTQIGSGAVSIGNIGQSIVASAVANGELTRREGIIELYRGGFGREPNAAGLAYWEKSTLSIAQMIASFSKGSEVYTPFANGGIVTSPTMGLIGEAGYNEAVIPLKNPNDPLGQKEVIAKLTEQNGILMKILKSGNTQVEGIENTNQILSEETA